ncbi:adenosylcobinamide amidohydrolase [Halobellus rufus]|uniref:adenosylcobinamide amidohydrolase n=1 Tax=Halobellus rufus TaxID=1448860 RepID=UPI0006799A5E|nr:adenosylcobinamide amidohydrolase [Halobellus rufus]
MFETTVRDEVCRLSRPGTRWLSTGYGGGESVGDRAFLVSVPEGWDDVDVAAYVVRRRRDAGFDEAADPADAPLDAAPALLTGVSMRHARRARLGPVEAIVTAGVSNPAALPIAAADGSEAQAGERVDEAQHDGTVNVVLGTTRSLASGALANLVAVAAEAKAATLLDRTGFPGTTSDAVLVGCDPEGESATFSGSATPVGSAARACVRDALLAALDARYGDEEPPDTVEKAEYGVVTGERARVSRIGDDAQRD